MNPKHGALWGEILWISIQTRRWNGAPRNVTFCCCSEDTWHFIAIWSYYKKCSVPLPPNFVKQDGLQGLLSIFWGYITLFYPPAFPRHRHFQLSGFATSVRTSQPHLANTLLNLFHLQHNSTQYSTSGTMYHTHCTKISLKHKWWLLKSKLCHAMTRSSHY